MGLTARRAPSLHSGPLLGFVHNKAGIHPMFNEGVPDAEFAQTFPGQDDEDLAAALMAVLPDDE